MTRTVLLAAGGTGGHLFPAAAFSQEMRARGWRAVLITDARGRVYAKDFPADAVEDVAASTFSGFNPFKAAQAGLRILAGTRAAARRIDDLRPGLVAGFGGYPSLPALSAARDKGVPILIHEQNAVLGRVNRHFAGAAQAIACGFERLDLLAPRYAAKKVVVGNPVRAPILAAREAGYPAVPAGGALHLLVIGGSQGARVLGEVIPAAIARLPADLRARLKITQQAREEQADAVRAAYAKLGVEAEISPFFADMAARYGWCHLVIARAGASSVTEIAVVGRPAILVPLAIATNDHQAANAEALTGVGAADSLREDAFTPDALAALLVERLSDAHALSVRAAAARAAGHPDAAQKLADLAERLAV